MDQSAEAQKEWERVHTDYQRDKLLPEPEGGVHTWNPDDVRNAAVAKALEKDDYCKHVYSLIENDVWHGVLQMKSPFGTETWLNSPLEAVKQWKAEHHEPTRHSVWERGGLTDFMRAHPDLNWPKSKEEGAADFATVMDTYYSSGFQYRLGVPTRQEADAAEKRAAAFRKDVQATSGHDPSKPDWMMPDELAEAKRKAEERAKKSGEAAPKDEGVSLPKAAPRAPAQPRPPPPPPAPKPRPAPPPPPAAPTADDWARVADARKANAEALDKAEVLPGAAAAAAAAAAGKKRPREDVSAAASDAPPPKKTITKAALLAKYESLPPALKAQMAKRFPELLLPQ